jgi:hypothetical protein
MSIVNNLKRYQVFFVIFGFVFGILFLFICSHYLNFINSILPPASSSPHTAYTSDLKSRALIEFPYGTSEEAIKMEYKAHVDTIALHNPDTEVLAIFFLNRLLTLEEFIRLKDEYALSGGENTTIKCKYLYELRSGEKVMEDRFSSLPAFTTVDELQSVLDVEVLFYHLNFNEDITLASEPVVAFEVYATTANLKKIWESNPDIIRAINVMGKRGQEYLIRYAIAPDDSFERYIQERQEWTLVGAFIELYQFILFYISIFFIR